MNTKKIHKKSAFSLIEVLIFVSIISGFFVVAAGTAIYTLRAVQTNGHRIVATRYADDLMEFLRGEKEADWNIFISTYGNKTFCFNNPIVGLSTGNPSLGPCSNFDGLRTGDQYTYNQFKREVTLTGDTNQITVAVVVSWREYGQLQNVTLNAIFSQLETDSPGSVPTSIPLPTATPIPVPTATPTPTPVPTATPIPVPTSTPRPTVNPTSSPFTVCSTCGYSGNALSVCRSVTCPDQCQATNVTCGNNNNCYVAQCVSGGGGGGGGPQ